MQIPITTIKQIYQICLHDIYLLVLVFKERAYVIDHTYIFKLCCIDVSLIYPKNYFKRCFIHLS